jgi:hypothetical protein
VRTQVDRDLTTVSRVDRRLGLVKNLGRHTLYHRACPKPLRCDPGDEVQWKYHISCQSKSQKANGEIKVQKTVIGNHTCSCSCQKPLLLHYQYSHVIDACLATKNQHWGRYVPKYFIKQTVRDTWNHTIEGYLHLGTFTQDPKIVRCTYQIHIQPCVKVSVDARRRGLGTTWMRLKLDLRGRYAPNATILDTRTRNAPKHLTFPLPLLHHLQLVHVDVVPVVTTKECSDRTCLCYRVVIIELLMHVVVL